MSPELAEKVVDRLDGAMRHVEEICLHLYGGEPLCNLPALAAMVKRAQSKGPGRFRFAVTTNGFCDSMEAIELLDAGRFQVILSIDGPADVHDTCRIAADGGRTHATVLKFLENLRTKTDCRVRGSAVVRSGWSLAEASAYLRTLPVHVIKSQAVRLPPGEHLALNEAEKMSYLRDLEEIGRQVIEELEENQVPRDDRYSSRVLQLLKGVKRRRFCGAGRTIFGITPDGKVLPCLLMHPDRDGLGHIREDPPGWLEKGRRWWSASRPKRKCRACSALPLCGGGCHALMPVCGEGECDIIRKNCEVATMIYEHFAHNREALLGLAGIV